MECSRSYRPVGGFAINLAGFSNSICIDPRGHRGRVGHRVIGDDDAFSLRQLLGVQQLYWACRFGGELTGRSPSDFLGACSLRNLRQIDIDVV